MKKIISGKKPYLLKKDIIYVTVPTYDEFKPSNVISEMELKTNKKDIWEQLKNFCPELELRDQPKDREFFYNILNKIKPNCIDKIVRNAYLNKLFNEKKK